jgi:hypothetical protein
MLLRAGAQCFLSPRGKALDPRLRGSAKLRSLNPPIRRNAAARA